MQALNIKLDPPETAGAAVLEGKLHGEHNTDDASQL